MHPPGLCPGGCIFISCLYTAQMGRQSPPISRYLLRKNTCTPLVRRRGPAARTIPLGISPQHNISPHPRRRKVRFAPLPPFRGKLRPLPCSSFSRRDRSAGSRWEFYTAPYWTIPLGIPPNITFPPIHSNGEWGAYSLIGLSNGRVPRTFIDSVRCWGKTRTQGVTNP